jgi:hypothetical protein
MSNSYGLLVQARPSQAIAGGTPRSRGEHLRVGMAVRALLAQAAAVLQTVAARVRNAGLR